MERSRSVQLTATMGIVLAMVPREWPSQLTMDGFMMNDRYRPCLFVPYLLGVPRRGWLEDGLGQVLKGLQTTRTEIGSAHVLLGSHCYRIDGSRRSQLIVGRRY